MDWAAAAPAAAHVLVDDGLDDELVITGDDGHHLARVRRLRPGERVTAADGRGRWRLYRITDVGRGSLELRAVEAERFEPALFPPLAVAFALTKGDKPEVVVARLTELGVDRIVPLVARHSVVRWERSRSEAARARLRTVAREAAMQCRRAWVPVLEDPRPPADLARARGLVVADRAGVAAGELPPPGPEGWIVAVGPEGGFHADELAALGAAPRLAVGPHVLRAETAAAAVAAALAGHRQPQRHHAG